MNIIPFDKSRFVLGSLCKYGHDYCQTGLTLRYCKSNNRCVECFTQQNRRYQQSEKGKKALKRYRQSDIGQENRRRYQKTPKRQEYLRLYEKSAKRKQSRKLYQNSEAGKLIQNRFWHSEKGKISRLISSNRRRIRKQQNPSIPYNTAQIQNLKEEFDNCCAYCGTQSEKLTVDHIVPIALGGADAINNLVPCCMSCNCRKCDTPVEEWYLSQPFFSEVRYKKILQERPLPAEPIVNRRRKLPPQEVAEIRAMQEAGVSYSELAKQFKVSSRTIGRIIRKERYYSK